MRKRKRGSTKNYLQVFVLSFILSVALSLLWSIVVCPALDIHDSFCAGLIFWFVSLAIVSAIVPVRDARR